MTCTYCAETSVQSAIIPAGPQLEQGDRAWGTKKDERKMTIVRFCPWHWDAYLAFLRALADRKTYTFTQP